MKQFFTLLVLLVPFCLQAKMHPALLQGHSSLSFIENKGQVTDQNHQPRADIQFKLNAPGLDIFIGKGQIHYQWSKAMNSEKSKVNNSMSPADNQSSGQGSQNKNNQLLPGDLAVNIQTYRLDVTLINANPNAKVVTEETQDYYENYYLPQCPDGIIAHSYKRITYKNIYPNIDWVLYFSNNTSPLGEAGRGFKYDFIVHKGGDPKNIKLQYNGATSLAIDKGALTATTPMGSITEQVPYTYNAITKKQIASSFLLHDNILSFDLATYNGEIVIDPQLDWATYYGGSGDECDFSYWAWSGNTILGVGDIIAVDALGFIYMTGGTASYNNIATSGVFQDVIAGTLSGMLAKFKNDGTLLWATYYGGSKEEQFGAVACDSNNDIYVAGISRSSGLGTPGVYQQSHDTTTNNQGFGYVDGIIVKFNNNGQRIWATYYGGNRDDWISDIAIGASNDLFISGYTFSTNGIATPGSYDETNNNNNPTCYLAKIDPAGQRVWGTYYFSDFGGSSIACDQRGNVYMAGNSSMPGAATPGTHQPLPVGANDAYLVKFNGVGIRQWGTFYGGKSDDYLSNILCDKNGHIYMTGTTGSFDSIATTGVFQQHISSTVHGHYDAFIAKFDTTGQIVWGSYFGGLGENDDFYGIAIDNIGDVCLAGYTQSTTGIATAGAWQQNVTDSVNGMFVKFDPDGQMLWATFYGGEKDDRLSSVAVDASNKVYLAGMTTSSAGIATPGSSQSGYGGGTIGSPFLYHGDLFLVKADPDSVVYTSFPDSVICLNSSGVNFQVGYIVSRSFRSGNIFTAQISDSSGSFASPFVIGSKTATASGFIDCHLPPAFILGKHYRIRVLSSAPFYIAGDNGRDIEIRLGPEMPTASTTDTLLCAGQTLHLFASSANTNGTYTWAGPGSFTSNTQNPVVNNIAVSGSGNYIVYADPVVCKMTDTVSVVVRAIPIKPLISTNAPVCEGDTLRFSFAEDTAGTFYTWAWPNPNVIPGQNTVVDQATLEYSGTYIVTAHRGQCTNADTADILIWAKPVVTVTSNSPVQSGQEIKLFATSDSANTTYYWTGPDSFSSALQNPIIPDATSFKSGTYTIRSTKNGCTGSAITIVVVNDGGDDVFVLFPNPNDGSFTIKGNVHTDQSILLNIYNAAGQLIYRDVAVSNKKIVNKQVVMPYVADGVYELRLRISAANRTIPFVIKH